MKKRTSPNLSRPMLAVPMAALMLGASEITSQAGIGVSFWGAYGGYGYGHGPITSTAFGIPAADWASTPSGDWVTAGTGSMTAAGLSIDWSSANTWVSVLNGDPDSSSGPWNSPLPGDPEVLWGYLDDGNDSVQAPAVTVTGLAAKFPSGYVVQTIAALDANPTSIANVQITSGAVSNTLTYSHSWNLYDWYGPVNGANAGTAFVSTPSSALTNDTLTIQGDLKGTTGNRSVLCGFIITDKPVVSACYPAATTILSGNSFTLSGSAIGLGTLTYQWKHDGTNVGTNSPTYTVSTADPADSGDYTLTVTSDLYPGEPALSQTVHVTVSVPATVAWDTDSGTTGAQGGSGTWDLSTTNWWDGASDIPWSNLTFATFGAGGSGTSAVTVSDDIVTSGMTIDGDYTFSTGSGKALTFASPSTVAVSGNTTLSLPIAGSGALTKTGSGTLNIVSRGSFSGPITVQEGTLAFPVTGDIDGYWYQWLLNTSVINLEPGTTLNCAGNAFGWYANNDSTGLTINVKAGSVCQPSGAFGIGYNLTGGRIGTGSNSLHIGSSGGFNSHITSLASDITSLVNPADSIYLRTDGPQKSFTFTTAQGTTPSGIDLEIASPIRQWTDTGSIVKAGPGTLKLSANNTYGGSTTVDGGTLIVSGQVGGTSIAVNAGALIVSGQVGGTSTTVNAGALTVTGRLTNSGQIWLKDDTSLNVTATASVTAVSTTGDINVGTDYLNPAGMNTITFSGLSSTSVAPVSSANLFLDSPVTVNISSIAPVIGQYPLMKITGTNTAVFNMTLGTLPPGITANLVNDLTGPSKSIYLNVSDVVVPTLIWAGTTDGTWDIATTENWSGASTLYTDGNIAEFDDTASPTSTDITLDVTVNPAEVGFYNSSLDYTIGGSGSIAGFTQLFKSGSGTLTLNNNNTYTGKTTVSGGTLQVGGTLATSEIANSGALVYDISSPQTVSYALTGGGSLTKAGAATLTLLGNKNFSGGITINEGTLHVNAGGWYVNPFGLSNTVTVNSGGTLSSAGAHSLGVDNNTIVINGGSLVLGAENYISGLQMNGGTVSGGELRTWGGTMTFGASTGGSLISSILNLVGGATFNVADGDAADDLTVSGVIGNSNGLTKTGDGVLRLTGLNTYGGDTLVNAGTLAVTGTSIYDTNKLVINGGKVDATGNETVDKLFFGSTQQAAGTWGATDSGAANIDDVHFSGTGVVTVVTGPPGFSAWAIDNAPNQSISMDHDNDGVSNGVEYFMGLSGSGFTANPAAVNGVVSWPKGTTYVGIYGTDYVVQTSTNLVDWVDVPEGELTSNGNPVQYTLPTTGPALFVRLKVTGP